MDEEANEGKAEHLQALLLLALFLYVVVVRYEEQKLGLIQQNKKYAHTHTTETTLWETV